MSANNALFIVSRLIIIGINKLMGGISLLSIASVSGHGTIKPAIDWFDTDLDDSEGRIYWFCHSV